MKDVDLHRCEEYKYLSDKDRQMTACVTEIMMNVVSPVHDSMYSLDRIRMMH